MLKGYRCKKLSVLLLYIQNNEYLERLIAIYQKIRGDDQILLRESHVHAICGQGILSLGRCYEREKNDRIKSC